MTGAAEVAAKAPIVPPNAFESVTPPPAVNPANAACRSATGLPMDDYGE